jgi:hypothetical protein
MKLYLLILLTAAIFATNAHPCQQVGSSGLGKLTLCQVTSPPPQLKWSINVTLLRDYKWLGADDVTYTYLTPDDQPIDETCYQGQTITGQYAKGSSLLVEHLCFGFKPAFTPGSKLYLLIFSSQNSADSQIVYLTYSATGQWLAQPLTEQERKKAIAATRKNLVQE